MFSVAPDLISDSQRRAAKTINFGIIYGMSAYGLSQRLGIEAKDAARFIEAYFERFPGVRGYTDATLASAKATGYVETLYGRCRFLPDINSRNFNLRENAKRMAINARIQGTAADVLKLAMIAVDHRLALASPRSRLLLTVHDELVIEVVDGEEDAMRDLVRVEMEGVAALAVPLEVELGVGRTWWDAKS
jgi:DNA polymerase-1